MITRLQIGSYDNLAIVEDIPIKVTYQQSDINDPEKRVASYSKPLKLYGTNEINRLFENIFEVNISTQSFNANLKTEAKYLNDEILVLDGYLQLLSITLTPDDNIVYDCVIIANTGSLFVDIGDGYVEDMDFSEYDHDYTRTNILNSWDNTVVISGTPTASALGVGYYYPLVNRGAIQGNETIVKVTDFTPCFYKREYVKKIIEGAGYTISSTFLDSEFFRRQFYYPNISELTLSQTELDNRQFYAGLTANQTYSDADGQSVTATTFPGTLVAYNKETTPYFDAGGNHSGGVYTCPATGTYNFVHKLRLKITITHTNPSAIYSDSILITSSSFRNYIRRLVGSTYSLVGFQQIFEYNTFDEAGGDRWNNTDFKSNFETNTPFYTTFAVGSGDVSINESDLIKSYMDLAITFARDVSNNPVRFYDSGMVIIGTGQMHVNVEIDTTGSEFYGLVTNKNIIDGDPIAANNLLPKKIKKRDMLKSIINEFNLQIEPDKNNPKLLYIEPYPDYYDADQVDWEHKLDLNKEFIVNPMSYLDSRVYIYKAKTDIDFWNKDYDAAKGEVFGTETININNDFKNQIHITEVIHSATHNVANDGLQIAYPKIYDIDGVTIKKITPNIRSLYAKKKTLTGTSLTFQENGSPDLVIQYYGYAGHTDDPFTPTIDLNFGIPKQVYYSYLGASFTDNNLYNRFHRQYIEEISSKDSKVVIAWLWLTSKDINEFSFRNKYFIKDAWYRVSKIFDFDPTTGDSTKCELLKLSDVTVFTPTNYTLHGLPNYSTERKINNAVDKSNATISGGDIILGANTTNITSLGSAGASIGSNLSNITLINSPGVEVTESNVTYINGNKIYNSFIPSQQYQVSGLILSADVNQLDTTPIEIIPAPGDGKIIIINSIATYINYGTAYTTTGTLLLKYSSGTDYREFMNTGLLTGGVFSNYINGGGQYAFDNTIINNSIQVYCDNTISSGSCDIGYIINYSIQDTNN